MSKRAEGLFVWLMGMAIVLWLCLVWTAFAMGALWLYRELGDASHVGIRERAEVGPGFRDVSMGTMYRAPTDMPWRATTRVAPTEPDEGAAIDVDQLGQGDYRVCAQETQVRGGPHDYMPVLYTLRFGEVVKIGERFEGWGMMHVPEWVWMGDLCRT